nr:hypothetical protein [uncultured Mediterranean phage uvMED]
MEVLKAFNHWALLVGDTRFELVTSTLSILEMDFFLLVILKSLMFNWSFISIESIKNMLVWNESDQRATIDTSAS